MSRKLTAAARDVLAERRRQVDVEGWDYSHDDAHADRSMALAAACYAMYASLSERARRNKNPAPFWPWAARWWKPKDRRRDLVRAGALILAEIERLDRSKKKPDGE